MVVCGCRSLVAEYWPLKPEALGSIPGGTAFLSYPLPLRKVSDSNGPDILYQSSDLGEPHPSGSLCCDDAQILSKSQTHSNYYLSTTNIDIRQQLDKYNVSTSFIAH